MSNRTEVAAKVEELSTTLNVDIEDVTITIEDGGFSNTVISGADVKEYLTKGEDESDDEQSTTEDTTEGGDDDEDTIEDGDDDETTLQLEELDYNAELKPLVSAVLEEYPDDQSQTGLIEAVRNKADIEDVREYLTSGEVEESSEKTDEENTTEGGENEEDTISDSELMELGVKQSNIEDVREYRSKNGVCSDEDCPYGANDDSEFCASHQGSSSSKSKTSKSEVSYDDLTSGQKAAVNNLLEEKADDDSFGVEEAVQMV